MSTNWWLIEVALAAAAGGAIVALGAQIRVDLRSRRWEWRRHLLEIHRARRDAQPQYALWRAHRHECILALAALAAAEGFEDRVNELLERSLQSMRELPAAPEAVRS